MLDYLKKVYRETNASPDGVLACVIDSFDQGLYLGSRNTECCQDRPPPIDKPLLNRYGRPKAFTLNRYEFTTTGCKSISIDLAIKMPADQLESGAVVYDYQKNGNPNEKKCFTQPAKGCDKFHPVVPPTSSLIC
mmetsp:Transcript_24602/g.37397  ORF Transcript_24602/g.37397 Transcript_24602/m.37397 type:complete len:134 (-) Transcript_24602:536-937(-)